MEQNIYMPQDINLELIKIFTKVVDCTNVGIVRGTLKFLRVQNTYEAPVLFMFASQLMMLSKHTEDKRKEFMRYLIELSMNITYEFDDKHVYLVFGTDSIFNNDGTFKQEKR